MAQTAKILNPDKKVLIPNRDLNGCSLADSITAEEVRDLKIKYPEHTFVCYINTTAEVKAQCDTCVTSSNVYQIIKDLPNKNIFFIPDKLMGKNICDQLEKEGVKKNILYSDGTCYVHEKYEPETIQYLKLHHPNLKVLCHPECTSGIVQYSDFVGSTSQMLDYVKKSDSKQFFLLTECGLTNRLEIEAPDKEFIGACSLCKYMKSNNLKDILRVLKNPTKEDTIEIEEEIRERALNSLNKMIKLTTPQVRRC